MSFFNKVISLTVAVTMTGIYSDRTQAQTETQVLQQIEQYNRSDNLQNQVEQVTNVNQLRDVSPADWSYEALRSLSDRYGCISGFPDETYRGNQPITRNEFAAGLNSCFGQIERSLSSSENSRESITYKRDILDAKIDALEAKVDQLK
ncbi:MAG: iron uptake porin [Cyanobacteria bacterium J06600_6]